MFEFNDVEESSFDLIPNCTVNVAIVKAEWYVSQGGSEGLSLEFSIMNGEHRNRRIFQTLWLVCKNPNMAKAQFVEILAGINNITFKEQKEKMGPMSKEVMIESLLGKTLSATVYTQKDKTGEYADKNQLRKFGGELIVEEESFSASDVPF